MLKVDRLPAKATFGSMSPSRIISREKSFDVYLKVTTSPLCWQPAMGEEGRTETGTRRGRRGEGEKERRGEK
eukprot:716809-Hanusia_phi.AAC.1